MANWLQHSSVHEKMYGKYSCRISRLSSDISHNRKYGPLTNATYVNLGSLFLSPPQSSTTVRPNAPTVSVGAPSEKGADGFLSFCFAGIVTRTAVAPIERVKLLIQNQNEMLKSGRLLEPYKGITHCFARTVKNEGFLSLWRGNSADIIRFLTIMGLDRLYSEEYFTRLFNFAANDDKGYDHYWSRFAKKMAAESVIGVSSHLVGYSFDYAYTRLANDIGKAAASKPRGDQMIRQFNGVIDVCKKTLKSDGVAGMYRGFNVSCAGVLLYRGLNFGAYDTLRPLLLVGNLQDNFLAGVMVKYGAILGAALACYPFDTVRRRMMMTSGEAIKYKNSRDAFSQIIKNEGAKSLFMGFGAKILHTSAITFAFVGYGWLQTRLTFTSKS